MKLALSISEAAEVSSIGRSTIYAEISKGNLRIRKVGRRTIVMMADLQAWLASKNKEAA